MLLTCFESLLVGFRTTVYLYETNKQDDDDDNDDKMTTKTLVGLVGYEYRPSYEIDAVSWNDQCLIGGVIPQTTADVCW